jgi:hypothetical protein
MLGHVRVDAVKNIVDKLRLESIIKACSKLFPLGLYCANQFLHVLVRLCCDLWPDAEIEFEVFAEVCLIPN